MTNNVFSRTLNIYTILLPLIRPLPLWCTPGSRHSVVAL